MSVEGVFSSDPRTGSVSHCKSMQELRAKILKDTRVTVTVAVPFVRFDGCRRGVATRISGRSNNAEVRYLDGKKEKDELSNYATTLGDLSEADMTRLQALVKAAKEIEVEIDEFVEKHRVKIVDEVGKAVDAKLAEEDARGNKKGR